METCTAPHVLYRAYLATVSWVMIVSPANKTATGQTTFPFVEVSFSVKNAISNESLLYQTEILRGPY